MSVRPLLSTRLELNRLFTHGVVRVIRAVPAGVITHISPERGKRWLIIGGAVTHLSASSCAVYIQYGGTAVDTIYEKTTTGPAINALFNTESAGMQSSYTPKIVFDELVVNFSGSGSDFITLVVIEW